MSRLNMFSMPMTAFMSSMFGGHGHAAERDDSVKAAARSCWGRIVDRGEWKDGGAVVQWTRTRRGTRVVTRGEGGDIFGGGLVGLGSGVEAVEVRGWGS